MNLLLPINIKFAPDIQTPGIYIVQPARLHSRFTSIYYCAPYHLFLLFLLSLIFSNRSGETRNDTGHGRTFARAARMHFLLLVAAGGDRPTPPLRSRVSAAANKEPPRTGLLSSELLEAAVVVSDAGAKGMGAYAAEPLESGRWVGTYAGNLTTREEIIERYGGGNALSASLRADYIFRIDDRVSIDAQNSSHFTRYLNHTENGSLAVAVDVDDVRVDFYAARNIEVGEELTFDYGCGRRPRFQPCGEPR